MSERVRICRLDGSVVWEGLGEIRRIASHFDPTDVHYSVYIDAPLELVPQEVPFVRLPKEDPDA